MALLAYPIQSIHIGGRRFGADYRFPMHVQTQHQFYAVLEGRVRVDVEGRSLLLKPGEALWMAPALRRSPRAASVRGRYLNVTFDSPWPALGTNGGERISLAAPALAEAKACADLAGADEYAQSAGFHALCFHLLGPAAFVRNHASRSRPQRNRDGLWLVTRLEQFMKANTGHPLGIADMGSLVNASRATLVRLFRQHRGLSPAACFRQIRLEHGRRLLRTTPLSVTEIAQETGFSSSQHFATAFRQHFGHSPSAWR